MNILDAIGNTPLFELPSFSDLNRNVKIYMKAEFLNQSDSGKDRAAKAMSLPVPSVTNMLPRIIPIQQL